MVQKALIESVCIIAIGTVAAMGLVSPGRVLAHSGHGKHAATSLAAGEPGDPTKPFRTLEVIMTDDGGRMAYTLDRVDVKKGEQIKFVVRNAGLVDHEFPIDTVREQCAPQGRNAKEP